MTTPRVTVRLADQFDIPFLQEEIRKQVPAVENVDLRKSGAIAIAELDGKPFCILPASPVWLVEPHLIFNAEGYDKMAIRRGMRLTYKAINEWIQNQAFTKQFCHIPEGYPNKQWAEKLGFTYVWNKAMTWLSKD